MTTFDTINLAIAAWGAITGSIAITLNVITFYTERPRLKLAWLRNFATGMIVNGRMRDTGERIARLLVTNVGRQPIRVIGAYGVQIDEKGDVSMFMFSDGLLDPSKNRVLSPEQPSTEYHLNESNDLDSIVSLSVNDGAGKSYRLWLVPWYRRPAIKRKMKRKIKSKQSAKSD